MKRLYLLFAAIFLASLSRAATFTSIASSSWTTPATWSVVGVDADGIPDNNDVVNIAGGFTVNMTTAAACQTLNINLGSTLTCANYSLLIYGDFTKNGGLGSAGSIQFFAAGTVTSSTLISSNTIYFYQNYTIAAGTVLIAQSLINITSNRIINNSGSVTCNSNVQINSGATWNNLNGSSLTMSGYASTGTLNASAATNTVTYQKGYTTIVGGAQATYYNLVLNTAAAQTKTLSGALTVNNDLTINALVTLNCNNFDVTIGRNWNNNANLTCTNMATATFNGGGAQSITRASTEIMKNLVVNKAAGTLTLATPLTLNGNFTITAGTFDVSAANFLLTIKGNFTNTAGTFTGRSGTVTFAGAAAQTISGAVTPTFFDVTSSNTLGGVSVTGTIIISDILTVNTQSFGTGGAGTIILPATAATTCAKIGVVGGSLVGAGWSAQAYIDGPATGYWQFLGSPINGSTLDDWDSDARFYMSGVGGNDGNACCPVFYSVRTYDEPSGTWVNVTTTATALTAGEGFMCWMADDMSTLTAPLVFDTKGTPSFGNKSIAVTAGGVGGGYNLVSNPYGCPITYATVVAASGNLNPNFYILQENGSYVANPNGGVIAGTQGFMCLATAGGNVNFTEAAKNTAANPNIIRLADPENFVRIRLTNDVNGLGGESVVSFQPDALNTFDVREDMPFLASPYDDASLIWTSDASATKIMLNTMNTDQNSVSIPLVIKSALPGNQIISFSGIDHVTAYSCAWLEDPSNGKRIDLAQNSSYSFLAEPGEERNLILHFDKKGTCPLDEQNIAQALDGNCTVFNSNGNLKASFFFDQQTDVTISIYDVEGKEISAPKQFTVTSETVSLENPYAHGVYFVKITQGEQVVTKKIFY
ncbi:MAG: T9SS type A sorting domain-containing protein [Bacteroidetes bacterium]|nr:T9SS type A sorting domain-containing protein [Bacteroidota bacterium]